jgi:DNA gyrase/topoisomerase IV subunit A
MGMRMDEADQVVGFGIIRPKNELFLMGEDGQAKRSLLSQFPSQGRNGKGVLAWKSAEQIRIIGAVIGLPDDRLVAHLARGASRSLRFSDAPRKARTGSGKQIVDLNEGNRVNHLTMALPKPVIEAKPKPVKAKTTKKAKPKAKKK